MKRIISLLMVFVMVFSVIPFSAFASETETESTGTVVVTEEPAPTEAPVPEEEVPTETPVPEEEVPTEAPVPEEEAPTEEPVPEEEPVPGDEALSTQSLEPMAEKESEPLVIHFFLASPGNITNPNGSYVNYYGPDKSLSWWPESYTVADIQERDAWEQIFTQQGIRNVYDEDIVTQYVASWPAGYNADTFKNFGSVKINGMTYYDTDYEIKWVSIMCRNNASSSWGLRCNQSSFQGDHIHIDGLLVEKIQPGEMKVFKALPEAADTETTFHFTLQKMRQANLTSPPTSADAVDTSFPPMTLTASIPAGSKEAQITGGSEISFGYYKLTENSSHTWQMAGIAMTDSGGNTSENKEARALYICIAPNGTVQYSLNPSGPYTVMSHVAIQNERKPVNVTYEWRVYNTNGTYTDLPAGAPAEPASAEGVKVGSRYVYDTEYVTGTSFYDYDNGLLYTFHGWDTYSHSDAYNPHPGTGYYALDDGDTNGANNPTIEITADTYIYGYWTVTELEPAAAHIAIEKVFIVDGVEVTMAQAEDLWFRIDTGIDRDGDGDSLIDVDYSMLRATGEYKIPVYQYDTPFVFTEHNADVPGYTRTTTIDVSGVHIVSSSVSGDSVTVAMEPVYRGENVHLGTVTYTNSYTKNIGTPIQVYPVLTLLKYAADTRLAQEGVEFTLYSDEACLDVLTTITTGSGGLVNLDFGAIEDIGPGTWYLKETAPLDGYHADPYIYAITLTEEKTVEELRGSEYVSVTYYTLSIVLPEGSAAAHESGSNRLYIFDEPILGSLELSKTVVGMNQDHQEKLDAVVIVHGPISRDESGSITDIGATWQLELNSENGWTVSLEKLPLGEYLIHESFASVHGYTWTGVTYGDLETTLYNGITSGIFRVEDENAVTLELTNTYEEWAAADFYIKKVDEKGNALAGAVFTLSTDEAGTNVFATRITGADGYAHFENYTVPEGQTSVTYYLREAKAPAGYYLSDQVYKVVITAVTDPGTGKVSFEPEITLVKGRANGFDIATDLLTVTNFPVLGEITITKAFENGLVPEGLTAVSVQISGPNGYSRTLELNNENGWSVTVEGLNLGSYTISELDADVPGYTWDVTYSDTTVTLTEENPGYTVSGTILSGNAAITNRYTRNEEVYEIPTSLTVKKVGENGEPLSGAVFTLDRLGADGKTVVSTVSFTTGAAGTVMFDLLSGSIVDGEAIDGTYILSETKAPEGYEPTGATWTVTIQEDDGEIRWTLNENKNIFEGFWDWIVGNVSAGSFENGVLTVRNVRSRGSLTVSKTVSDAEGMYADAEYSFTLDFSDDSFDKTFTLKAGESITFEDIPWGTTYTLTEDTTGAAFTAAVTDQGNGRIWAEETRITVTNTYAYTTHNEPLSLVKVDADDNSKVIPGAGFTLYADAELKTPMGTEVFSDENGCLALPIEAAGTYYLAETTTPAGYHANATIYVVTAEEKTVVLNAGTADAVTEIQMHIRISGLAGTTNNQIDYTYPIENTAIKTLTVNVEKIWADGGYHARPEALEVTLYRNNEAFETVTLSDENNWHYSWTGLTDEYTWSVDEAEIPAEYVKTVTNDSNDWTITNTRTPNPVEITVTKAWNHNGGKDLPESITVTLYKDGEAYDTVLLNEENSWTYTWEDLDDASQWSVDETDVPAGYTKEITVDGYEFVITNTRTINPVEVSVTKVWVASEGVIHPESVEAVLYRDGQEFATVILNAENQWSHIWTGLTDEYTWSVDEKNVPEGYTKNVTNEGYNFTITNTREFAYIDVSVNKIWYGTGVAHPTSVRIALYRNGVLYDTVTLSASNNWSHTWENLTDEFAWTVDEPSVPSGYNKTVRRNGNSFTVVNTHVDNPKTGDFTDLMGMGTMTALGIMGFGFCLLALFAPRRKEENEE